MLKTDCFPLFFQGFMDPVYITDIWENFHPCKECRNVIKRTSTRAYFNHGIAQGEIAVNKEILDL